MSMKNCPFCMNGTLSMSSRKKGDANNNKSAEIRLLDIRCNLCGDTIQKHIHSKRNTQSLRDWYALINGLLTSSEVRKIRKQLNLTQKNAARICGGGTNAFSRYERGDASPLRSTSNLLRLLSRHPEEIEHLIAYCN